MTAHTFRLEDFQLMRGHAGFSYDPRTESPDRGAVRCALELARALSELRRDHELFVAWEPSGLEWDGCEPYDGPLFDAILYRGEDVVGSLGAIAVPDTRDPYCRVIEAELVATLEAQREAMIVRGDS